MNKAELFKKIQELSFTVIELQLFLDTHPECRAALDYYHRMVMDYDAAVKEYEGKYGPITATSNKGESWNWIKGPWPWHFEANGGVGADEIDGGSMNAYHAGRK